MSISILTVNYNSTELVKRLLESINKFQQNIPIVIIDGSDKEEYINEMIDLCKSATFSNLNIDLHTMGYNIHHGTGMNFGLHLIKTKYVLIMDNDAYLTRTGVIEILLNKIDEYPELLFIGCQMFVNESGKTVILDDASVNDSSSISKLVPSELIVHETVGNGQNLIKYIHPSFMFVDREKYVEYIKLGTLRPFIKHGAPCITTMCDIKEKKLDNIICDMTEMLMNYFIHDWNGVVKKSGGYHLSQQHHFGNAKNGYADISSNIDDYLKQQKEYDDEIFREDEQIKAKSTIKSNPKKYGQLSKKKKLNKKELNMVKKINNAD